MRIVTAAAIVRSIASCDQPVCGHSEVRERRTPDLCAETLMLGEGIGEGEAAPVCAAQDTGELDYLRVLRGIDNRIVPGGHRWPAERTSTRMPATRTLHNVHYRRLINLAWDVPGTSQSHDAVCGRVRLGSRRAVRYVRNRGFLAATVDG